MPLSPPPRDAQGNVTPHNHEGIQAEDGVIRRIPSRWVIDDVKVPGGKRLSTQAFEPSSSELGGGLSVDLEHQIVEAGIDLIKHLTSPKWIGSIRLTAGQLRQLNLMVGFSPIEPTAESEGNAHHGEVWGRTSKSQRKTLLHASTWLVEIEGCSLIY